MSESTSTPERQPLIGSRNNNRPRRRGVNQHFHDSDFITINNSIPQHYAPPSQQPTTNDTYKDNKKSSYGGGRRMFITNLKSFFPSSSSGRGGREESSFYDNIPQNEKENIEHYRDDYNDLSWSFTCGTREEDGVWLVREDMPGVILALLVWILIIYSCVTVVLLAREKSEPPLVALIYCTVCALSLMSHAKTMLTDPGTVPESAVPIPSIYQCDVAYAMCSQCQTFKPKFCHHCRICCRCIARMDHHCPWMNNCIGAGNMKHFILFLLYTWIGSSFALLFFAWHYFLCIDDGDRCYFSPVLANLVRIKTVICLVTLLFTSAMLMNAIYGLMTGIGTIDRMKKKASNTMMEADEEPIPLKDVFGVGPYFTWIFPIDPLFEDFDRVMGYSTTQRLLRQRNGDMEPSFRSFR